MTTNVTAAVKDEVGVDTIVFTATQLPAECKLWEVEVHDRQWPDAKVVRQEAPNAKSAANNHVTMRLRPRSKTGRELVWRAREKDGDWSEWQFLDCNAARNQLLLSAGARWESMFDGARAAKA